jgi:predicted DNA-binding transcriptional regulator AlpA
MARSGRRRFETVNLRERLQIVVDDTPKSKWPDLIGEFARMQTVLALRVSEITENDSAETAAPNNGDRLLDAREAARILGVEPRWLYRRADRLPFTRRLSPRTLRFSELGLQRWIKTRS